jgi:hypothetical protein
MEGLLRLAPVGVALMIVIVAYGCQVLFHFIEPGPLNHEEFLWLNTLVAATWVCFARACLVDPGRVPADWKLHLSSAERDGETSIKQRSRWCKRCEAPKPPRAHHCKTCRRYDVRLFLHSCSDIATKMHPQDGPPLSVDGQLRVKPYHSSFHANGSICYDVHGLY